MHVKSSLDALDAFPQKNLFFLFPYCLSFIIIVANFNVHFNFFRFVCLIRHVRFFKEFTFAALMRINFFDTWSVVFLKN